MENAFFVWSGGKDSALALHRVIVGKKYAVKYLLTTVNETLRRITMHGVRVALLEAQAQALGIPLIQVLMPENPDMAAYNQRMLEALTKLKIEGIETAIFGDIFLEDLRAYREKQMAGIGMKAIFPLWQENTTGLIHEFTELQFKAVLVCVSQARLGKSFIGREINAALLADLPPHVDPCGENGEYHSFVYDGPIFQRSVAFRKGEIIFRNYAVEAKDEYQIAPYDSEFWFLDLVPAPETTKNFSI